MESLPWIIVSVLGLLIVFAVLAVVMTRKKKHKVDYYALFVMGLVWMPFGMIFEQYFFFILGIAFMTLGLVNKDKWKKNHVTLAKMDKGERKMMVIILLVLGILALLGLMVFYLFQRNAFN